MGRNSYIALAASIILSLVAITFVVSGGAEGPEGPIGLTGDPGIEGPVGPKGPTGAKGVKGVEGPTGPKGAKGAKGDRGPEGPEGPAGSSKYYDDDNDEGTIVLQVRTGLDDCYIRKGDRVYGKNVAFVIAGADGDGHGRGLASAMRFVNVTIPQGSYIVEAYLKIYASMPKSNTTVRTRIMAHDAIDSGRITSYTDFKERSRTVTAKWDEIPAWTSGWYTSPDIWEVIQQLVDNDDWSSGSAVTIIWSDEDFRSTAADVKRVGFSYEGSASKAPKLEIAWEY